MTKTDLCHTLELSVTILLVTSDIDPVRHDLWSTSETDEQGPESTRHRKILLCSSEGICYRTHELGGDWCLVFVPGVIPRVDHDNEHM